jgi:hypothetical protein
VALESRTGILVDLEVEEIHLREEPSPPESMFPGVYGFGNEGRAHIYPDGRPIGIGTVGKATVRIDSSIERFSWPLDAGLSMPDLPARVAEPWLRIGVDLFLGSFFEGSDYARFLARISVLEVLKTERDHPPDIQNAVARWQEEVADLMERGEVDSATASSLTSSLGWLKRESIGRSIARLALENLGEEAARHARGLYDLRSRMVHFGETPPSHVLSEALTSLTDLVNELLHSLLATPLRSGP